MVNAVLVNRVLDKLRELADVSTAREMNGVRVADILPIKGKPASLTRWVANEMGEPQSRIQACVSLLGQKGLLQPGKPSPTPTARWVALDGEYIAPE